MLFFYPIQKVKKSFHEFLTFSFLKFVKINLLKKLFEHWAHAGLAGSVVEPEPEREPEP